MESSLFFTIKLVLWLVAVADALHDQKESLRLDGRKNILINENSLRHSKRDLGKRSTRGFGEKTKDKEGGSWQPLNFGMLNLRRRSPCGGCSCSLGCAPGPWYPPIWGCGGPWGCGGWPCGQGRWCRKLFFIFVKHSLINLVTSFK